MKTGNNPIRIPYSIRWGRPRTKVRNGSWQKDARRERAEQRALTPCPVERTRKYRLAQAA